MSKLLTVAEVARLLNVSEDTVTRRFQKEKGVIDIGSPETPKRRRYRVLRIPTSVVEKYLLKRGAPVNLDLPSSPEPARKKQKDLSEDDLVMQLARITSQHGAEAQKTLDTIAERARLLKFVPEDLWRDIVWFSDENDNE
jgi:hypothetical protein